LILSWVGGSGFTEANFSSGFGFDAIDGAEETRASAEDDGIMLAVKGVGVSLHVAQRGREVVARRERGSHEDDGVDADIFGEALQCPDDDASAAAVGADGEAGFGVGAIMLEQNLGDVVGFIHVAPAGEERA
jgi:hypothetical protein